MSDKRTEADIAFIEELARLLNTHDLSEIEVDREYGEDDELHVRLSKSSAFAAPAAPAPMAAPQHALPAPQPSAAPAAVSADAAEDLSGHPGLVTSPMVGTVYLQGEPGSPPFAGVGAQVAEGATLLIVEAMKTMNHIPAPKSGTVTRVLVADGEAVEFGTPLMIVE